MVVYLCTGTGDERLVLNIHSLKVFITLPTREKRVVERKMTLFYHRPNCLFSVYVI